MGDEEENNTKKKKKNASKYNYTFGDFYPPRHKLCDGGCIGFGAAGAHVAHGAGAAGGAGGRPGGMPVPSDMGWLWNAPDIPGLKPTKGWQPGRIGKSVAKLMVFKTARSGMDGKKDKKKKKKRKPGEKYVGGGDSEPDEPLEPKPTLKVQRKGDTFTIQVNPLKDLTEIAPNEDPYVNCDPLIFKIIKKRSPEEQAKVEARKMVKLKKQRVAQIRKALAEAVEDICKCAYMDVFCNDLSAIDRVIDSCPAFKEPDCICQEESMSSLSSNATWDIEYTPPFGCFDLTPKKRKHYIHVETQYTKADAGIVEPPKSPKCTKCPSGSVGVKRHIRKQCCCKLPSP